MDICVSGQSFVTLEDHLGAAQQKTQISFLISSALRSFCFFMSVSVYHNVSHGQVVFLTVALFWYTWLGFLPSTYY
jgi:hypothetical protein